MKPEKPINESDTTLRASSLCWECARACGGANCPWADKLKPVPGWIVDSDAVMYCPRFFRGRNKACMTQEQLESTTTNIDKGLRMCRLHTKFIKDHRNRIIGKRFECPICHSEYDSKGVSCTNPECKAIFLNDRSSNYALSFLNLQVRQLFLREQSMDFPNSKYTDMEE